MILSDKLKRKITVWAVIIVELIALIKIFIN